MADVVELTKELVSIPSYLSSGTNEVKLAQFVENFIRSSCPSIKQVERQQVIDGRYNITAKDEGEPKLVFACHLDTVAPTDGGKSNPLEPSIEGDKMFGLGTKDMKGGTASLLSAVANFKETKGLFLLFYIDEEKNLRGMKKFVKEINFKPSLIVSPESKFEIANGRRGIISVEVKAQGSTAHTARPHLGINAVEKFYEVYGKLKQEVENFEDQNLGKPSCSLVYVKGGVSEGGRISKRLNIVPDLIEAAINIRTPSKDLNARSVKEQIIRLSEELGLKVKGVKVSHDFKPSFVGAEKLGVLEQAIKTAGFNVNYSKDIKHSGYNDVALINEKTGADFVNFGPYGEGTHSPNEWVSVSSLKNTQTIFEKLIGKICT